jgi:hypothetical protein
MRCDQCNTPIEPGEEKEHLGRTLCEDCYMDALSPPKGCDPWAVYTAKSCEARAGGNAALTPLQERILGILKETGGVEPRELHKLLGGEPRLKDLERELAVLRHMEKVRGEKRGDRVVIRLW